MRKDVPVLETSVDVPNVMRRVPHVLPLVLRIRAQIDDVFARYVGPISGELSQEVFVQWRTEGDVGPRGLRRYIGLLSRYIPQANQRDTFIGEAAQCIQLVGAAKT